MFLAGCPPHKGYFLRLDKEKCGFNDIEGKMRTKAIREKQLYKMCLIENNNKITVKKWTFKFKQVNELKDLIPDGMKVKTIRSIQ